MEHKSTPANPNYPITNDDIDKIVESYRQQNTQCPIGLAKKYSTFPDDFNERLPDKILDLPLIYNENIIGYSWRSQ